MVKLNGNPYRKNVTDKEKDEAIILKNEQNELLREILNELKELSLKVK